MTSISTPRQSTLRQRLHHCATLLLTAALLTACSGGGGGDSGGGGGGNGGGSGGTSVNTANLFLLAGTPGGSGNLDGTGTAARFSFASGMTSDRAGNLYVADSNNNTIRKITPAGVVSTLAGTPGVSGATDGDCAKALFYYPVGIAADSVGNLYVADSFNNTVRKITPACAVSTLAGSPSITGGAADGTGAAASFHHVGGITLDTMGNLYVADTGNHTIRRITSAGVVTTLAGTALASGSTDGTGMTARFNNPLGIVSDSANNLYVADTGNHTVRKITSAGVVSTLAGTAGQPGSADGTGSAARFKAPYGITADSADNLYVADSYNSTIRKITPAGVVSTLAGTAGMYGATDGVGAAARFNFPTAVKVDSTGNLYVTDGFNYTIRKVTPAGVVSTLAGRAPVTGSADGPGMAALFNRPAGMVGDSAGNVYVADSSNYTIRKINPAGVVSTLAGMAGASGFTDGAGTAALFDNPAGMASDSAGNVYVADNNNSTIRKITPAGVVSTLAGTAGVQGSTDGVGVSATFAYPNGIASDSAGNVYVTDSNNCAIRKITPAGVVTTLAGSGTAGAADGVGTAASFRYPNGIVVDSTGNVFVADTTNHTIRKITPAGVVSTLAGMAGMSGSADGTGAAARFQSPYGLTADSAGNLYAADSGNSTIRKITPAGVVSTVLGRAGQAGLVLGPLPTTLGTDAGWVSAIGDKLFISTENSVVWTYLP
jgi:sugar lactone lactonase YvrE